MSFYIGFFKTTLTLSLLVFFLCPSSAFATEARKIAPISKTKLIQSLRTVSLGKARIALAELVMWQGLQRSELIELINVLERRPQLTKKFFNPLSEIVLLSLKKLRIDAEEDAGIVAFLKRLIASAAPNAHNRHELIYFVGKNRLWRPEDLDLALDLVVLAAANGGERRLDSLYPLLRDAGDFGTDTQRARLIAVFDMIKFHSLSRSLILFRIRHRPWRELLTLLNLFMDDYAEALRGRKTDHVSIDFGDYDEALSALSNLYLSVSTEESTAFRHHVRNKRSYIANYPDFVDPSYQRLRLEGFDRFMLGEFVEVEGENEQARGARCESIFAPGD
jgi:hypothetical protein